jgi:hypothetical protein
MPWIIAGGALLGGLMSSSATSSAASTQAGAAESGIDEQRRQFDAMRQLLSPYIAAGQGALGQYAPYQAAGAGAIPTLQQFAQAGAPALEQQQALAGLSGPEAERAAIERISGGEQFKALAQQGEEAMLQRASATGGLRGGNIQGALAQFRPQLLNQLIEQQYSRLGGLATQGGNVAQNLASQGMSATSGLASLGQASAAGTGAAGQATGTNIANLLGQRGAAEAGGQLAGAAPFANLLGMPLQMAGMNYGRTGQFGLPGFGGLFGGSGGGGGGSMDWYNNAPLIPMQPGGGY